jgi:hypothetical protein
MWAVFSGGDGADLQLISYEVAMGLARPPSSDVFFE